MVSQPESSQLVPSAGPAFTEALGVALHQAGAPSHFIEVSTARVAAALGLEGGVLATPTALYVRRADGATRVVPVRPQEAHLERLVEVNHLARGVAMGWLSASEGLEALAGLSVRAERYGTGATVAAFSATSAAATVLLGGGLQDVGPGAVVGLAVGAAVVWLGPRAPQLMPLVAGLLAAGLATLFAGAQPLSVGLVALSGLIVLVPGLSLTVSIAEVAAGLWASGVHRLTGAAVSVLQMAVGAAVGKALGTQALAVLWETGVHPGPVSPVPVLAWWAALAVMPVTFAVLFRARPADVWVVALAAWSGFATVQLLGDAVGPEAASTAGALVVGLVAHAQARARTVPAAVAKFPGILLLVPGSVSFRGLAALLEHQVVQGVETAFSAVLLAACLVTGLTLAEVLLPPPRRQDWVG